MNNWPIDYEEVISVLSGIDDWLISLNIKPKYDRLHRYIDVLRCIQQKIKTDGPATPDGLSQDLFGLQEGLEFYDIMRAFAHEPSSLLRSKLVRALSGSAHPSLEQKHSTDARNITFELALAAEWKLLGLDVMIGEPDITLRIGTVEYIIECKRPYRAESIRPNVRDAADQLSKELNKGGREAAMGVIAISVGRVLYFGQTIWHLTDLERSNDLGSAVHDAILENRKHWTSYDIHSRVAAVLARLRHSEFDPPTRRCTPAFHVIMEKVTSLYNQ